MTLLGSCWYIIENVLIRDGFEKWYCLCFYINPFFLIPCQLFLWFQVAATWLYSIISQPLIIVWIFSVWVLRFSKVYAIRSGSSAKSTNSDVFDPDASDIEAREDCFDAHRRISDESSSIMNFQRGTEFANEDIAVVHGNELLQEILDVPSANLVCPRNLDVIFSHDVEVDLDMDGKSLPLSFLSESSFDHSEEEMDPFYTAYLERMRWFDLLNLERTCGINKIFNKQLGSHSTTTLPLEYIMARDIALPYVTKLEKRKLTRSIESDIERVYVGQTCLCWEALNHQYRKVEALLLCSTDGFFNGNVAGDFQNFQVLLERFIETESPESRRYWNYVEGRFSLKSLLQVPEVSGYFEEENEGSKGESMRARDVLRSIENSMNAFLIFINKEDKKPWWKITSSLWTHPQVVEDPKDLLVVADLKKQLQQKQLFLKGIMGKKKCWLNRNYYHQQQEALEESQTIRDVLFYTIELKLVSRVLNMSLISTSQISWCEEKLTRNEMEFSEGRVVVKYSCSSGGACLFPP